MEYEFTLRFKVPEDQRDLGELVERLGECGCNDSMVGTGVNGRIALEFVREATTAEHAILSAIRDVRKAIRGAELIEASPDLVGLSDVAECFGVSRQYVRKLTIHHGETFPTPIHQGNPSLWHMSQVLEWVNANGIFEVNGNLLEIAKIAMQVNQAKVPHHLAVELARKIKAVLAQ
jgi:predicted DNA-binding transcriptional regulator AlpA